MELIEKAKELLKKRNWAVFMTVCGIAGLLLIMISAVLPEKAPEKGTERDFPQKLSDVQDYCTRIEKSLEDFLGRIDGAGEVKAYITAESSERYVYATEGRRSTADNKTEEEEKYVMIGSGSEKNALIESVKIPKVTGAVILCSGGDSAVVREKLYSAVSAALDLPTAHIYVTKLR